MSLLEKKAAALAALQVQTNKSGVGEFHKRTRAFGGPLFWERLDERRTSRLRAEIRLGGLLDENSCDVIQRTMVDAMVRLAPTQCFELLNCGTYRS
jgi:hypothetical protein